jgi:hypothetical protein
LTRPGARICTLGRDQVFYDRYHEADLARLDMDLYLQAIYHDRARLVVVFIGADYERKQWPGLEWRAVRDLIKQQASERIVLVRIEVELGRGFEAEAALPGAAAAHPSTDRSSTFSATHPPATPPPASSPPRTSRAATPGVPALAAVALASRDHLNFQQ